MTMQLSAAALLLACASALGAQPNGERFRLLAVTEGGIAYVDTVDVGRGGHAGQMVTAVVRFVHDSATRPIGSIAAPVVTDLRAVIDCRAGWVRDSGATHYDAAGATTVIPPPRWPADPQATGIPWSALGKDGTLNNDGARMYSRVCWLFAPQYGVDLTPPKPKRKRGGR